MQIDVSEDQGVHVVTLNGKLDTATSPETESRLRDVVGGGASKIVIDFQNVDFVSSAGLRVLLATAKMLRGSGGEMRVCGLNEVVQEVFDISGFSSLLSVQTDRRAALASF